MFCASSRSKLLHQNTEEKELNPAKKRIHKITKKTKLLFTTPETVPDQIKPIRSPQALCSLPRSRC
jgi:hypothetical protein